MGAIFISAKLKFAAKRMPAKWPFYDVLCVIVCEGMRRRERERGRKSCQFSTLNDDCPPWLIDGVKKYGGKSVSGRDAQPRG